MTKIWTDSQILDWWRHPGKLFKSEKLINLHTVQTSTMFDEEYLK